MSVQGVPWDDVGFRGGSVGFRRGFRAIFVGVPWGFRGVPGGFRGGSVGVPDGRKSKTVLGLCCVFIGFPSPMAGVPLVDFDIGRNPLLGPSSLLLKLKKEKSAWGMVARRFVLGAATGYGCLF